MKKLLSGQFNIGNYRNILNKTTIKVIDKANNILKIMLNENEICYKD
ncbi:hypothetical protein I3900191A7_29560 [Clostridium baratii]